MKGIHRSLYIPRYIYVCMLCFCLLTLTSCTKRQPADQGTNGAAAGTVSEIQNDLTEKYPAQLSGSYSIFEETMVDMPWPEIEKAAQEGAVVLFVSAVIEEHGPHMSSGIDTYLGYLTCKLVRRELESRGVKTVIAPPFYWGINRSTHVFPGTFTVRTETMKALLHDIFASLKSWGFNDIFTFISHGDGSHVLTTLECMQNARRDLGLNTCCLVSDRDVPRYRLSGGESHVLVHKFPPIDLPPMQYLDVHAGLIETGLVAAYFPGLVDTNLARKLEPSRVKLEDAAAWLQDTRRVTPLGYAGDPASFNAVMAKEFWNTQCRFIADAIEQKLGRK
ncbi:creatininase family protein [candidate division KSB1 bacterium]